MNIRLVETDFFRADGRMDGQHTPRRQQSIFAVVLSMQLNWIAQQIIWEGVDWLLLTQDRGQCNPHGDTVIDIRVPQSAAVS